MGLLSFAQGAFSGAMGSVGMAAGRLMPTLTLPDEAAQTLRGKRVIVSGANSGIGYETALLFATHGATVVLLCRSLAKAEATEDAIRKATGNQNVSFALVDFSSLASVRKFVEEWNKRGEADARIDILVNNAGTPSEDKTTTQEGFELCFVTNHLSHLVLTLGLIPHFPSDGQGRIINVSSLAQYWTEGLAPGPGKGNSKDLLAKIQEGAPLPSMTTTRLYARSKAGQTVATIELTRRLKGKVIVNAMHPGLVRTNIWSRSVSVTSLMRSPLTAGVGLTGITPDQSAVSIALLATSEDPKVKQGGKFYDRMGEKWLPSWMLDEKKRQALWEGWIQDASAQDVDLKAP